jgi:hypothetical protein
MKITVNKAFTLMQKDGTPKPFGVGVQEATDEEAAHWYVKAHADVDEAELAASVADKELAAAKAEQAAADAAVAAAAAVAGAAAGGKKGKAAAGEAA